MISGVVFVDIHTATEMAYKNGYLKGFTQVREETFGLKKMIFSFVESVNQKIIE